MLDIQFFSCFLSAENSVVFPFYTILSDCEGCGSNEICTTDLMCKCDEGFIRDANET